MKNREKYTPRLEVNVTQPALAFFIPEDFVSDEEWEEFVKKMQTDNEFARNQVMSYLLDCAIRGYELFERETMKVEVKLIAKV